MEETNYLLNIDVLGFGDFVKNNSTQIVIDFYAKIITGSVFGGEIIDKNNIEVMVYSDTIAIKSNNVDKNKALADLIKIGQLIQVGQYYSAINPHSIFLPVRGTITHGEFVFHKGDIWTQTPGREKIEAKNINLIFGKPIVESYYFEKDIEMITIALSDSVIQKVNQEQLDLLIGNNLLIKYSIALKDNKSKEGYLINPTSKSHFELNIKRLESEKDKFTLSPSVCDKYQNTINLFNYINEKNLYHPKIKF